MTRESDSGPPPSEPDTDLSRFYSGGDGSSKESAVIIDLSGAPDDVSRGMVGIQLEHHWIGLRFPGAQLVSQSTVDDQGRAFDLFTIRLPSGEEKMVYFDLGSFFAKPESAPPLPEASRRSRLVWLASFVGLLLVVGMLAWSTRARRLTEVNPLWIIFFGGLFSWIGWLKALPAMIRSRLAGGRLHLVVAAAVVLIFIEWLSIWHFLPGAKVYLDNFSGADVELFLDNKSWLPLPKGTSRTATLSRGSRGLTVREAGTGRILDQHPIDAYDSGPYVLNVLGAQTYYRGTITYNTDPWLVPGREPTEETLAGERWFQARVTYLFERPAASIEVRRSERDRFRPIARSYLLRHRLDEIAVPEDLLRWQSAAPLRGRTNIGLPKP
jgi:hypothetical protein